MSLLQQLARRVGNMLILTGVKVAHQVGGAMHLQTVQLSGRAGEIKDNVQVLTGYGLLFRPLPPDESGHGPETVVLAIEPDFGYALPPADRRWMPQDLAEGEGGLYTDEDRDGATAGHCHLFFRRGRLVEIRATTLDVQVTGNASVVAGGDATVQAAGNATVEAGAVARLAGDEVHLAAGTKLKFDVNGYGEDWVYDDASGEYRVDTWHIGNVVAGSSNPIDPPEHDT